MINKNSLQKEIVRVVGITVGVAVEALSYALFLTPFKIAPGGMVAVAIIIHDVTIGIHLPFVGAAGLPIGLTYFILNLPWVFLSWKRMGKKYVVRTIIVSFVVFVFIDSFIAMFGDNFLNLVDKTNPSNNLMLAAIFGGILNGLGIGITFKNRASAGGTDLISQVVHYYTGIPFGQAILLVDSIVIICLGFYFNNAAISLYAFIALVVSSFVIDLVQEGISYTKRLTIVTDNKEEVKQGLLNHLGRGLTVIKGEGGYSGSEKSVMMIAVHRSQISQAKNIILEADPSAFIMISPLNEVIGEGFKKPKIEEW
ncbi:MAG TPA: YitT family protein [Caldisericia bacterium]|nr:YitT family protein [Caldisericia bacterium]HPF48948.1 YitT family protein [Caldisericia bacterium]HPI83188.1 YitT family protein [Caldisericia bacterium]HPQ92415.1 YitT family protein [Caldisericia bacterium]HRV74487.1 YitT family protein [Caldisericia bacterium]